VRPKRNKASLVYVIRRSDGSKWYIDDRTGAGTARSNVRGRAARFWSKWGAWRVVLACGVPENWTVVRLVGRGKKRGGGT